MDVTCANEPDTGDLAGPLRILTGRLYARFRARGSDRASAVEQAAEVAAQSLGVPVEAARRVAAAIAADRARPM